MSQKELWDIDSQKLTWAKQHDWYVGAVKIPSTSTWRINCKATEVIDGAYVEVVKSFEIFKELREWAGY